MTVPGDLTTIVHSASDNGAAEEHCKVTLKREITAFSGVFMVIKAQASSSPSLASWTTLGRLGWACYTGCLEGQVLSLGQCATLSWNCWWERPEESTPSCWRCTPSEWKTAGLRCLGLWSPFSTPGRMFSCWEVCQCQWPVPGTWLVPSSLAVRSQRLQSSSLLSLFYVSWLLCSISGEFNSSSTIVCSKIALD